MNWLTAYCAESSFHLPSCNSSYKRGTLMSHHNTEWIWLYQKLVVSCFTLINKILINKSTFWFKDHCDHVPWDLWPGWWREEASRLLTLEVSSQCLWHHCWNTIANKTIISRMTYYIVRRCTAVTVTSFDYIFYEITWLSCRWKIEIVLLVLHVFQWVILNWESQWLKQN